MLENDPGMEMAKAAAEGFGKGSADKLANVFGGIFPFWGLKHKAVETYVAEIQKSDLSPEMKMLVIANTKRTFKQLKNQGEIANIAREAAKSGTDFSEKSAVDDEWLERIMDSAKFVSDKKLQAMWGQVIAKEFEEPGTTPPSVIRILAEITPKYARIFQVLCDLHVNIIVEWESGEQRVFRKLILPQDYSYLKDKGIDFESLSELQSLGVIQFNDLECFVSQIDSEVFPKLHIVYGNNEETIIKYENKRFPIGVVRLTRAGKAIARFSNKTEIQGHFEAVCDYLKSKKVEFADKTEIDVSKIRFEE